jgi:hypothetical protein
MKHTPGPWTVLQESQRVVVQGAGGELVAQWHLSAFIGFGEAHANARLIAAAPELLAMLELLLSITEEFKGAMAGKQRLMWDEVSARTADIRDGTEYPSKGG